MAGQMGQTNPARDKCSPGTGKGAEPTPRLQCEAASVYLISDCSATVPRYIGYLPAPPFSYSRGGGLIRHARHVSSRVPLLSTRKLNSNKSNPPPCHALLASKDRRPNTGRSQLAHRRSFSGGAALSSSTWPCLPPLLHMPPRLDVPKTSCSTPEHAASCLSTQPIDAV